MKVRLVAFLSVVLLLAACAQVDAPQELEAQGSAPTTVVLSEFAGKRLEKFQSNGKLVFKRTSSHLIPQGRLKPLQTHRVNDLKVGQIVVSPPTKSAPYGLLQKITRKRYSASKITYETRRATLEEAIKGANLKGKNLSARTRPELNLKKLRVLYDPKVIDLRQKSYAVPRSLRDAPTLLHPAGKWDIVNRKYCFDKTVRDEVIFSSIRESAQIKGCVDLDLHVDVGLDVALIPPKIDTFHATAGGKMTAQLNASAGSGFGVSEEFVLASFDAGTTTLWLGPIPIVLNPTYSIVLNIDGSISSNSSLNAMVGMSGEYGARYHHSTGWKPVRSIRPYYNFNVRTPTIVSQLDLALGGEAGVYLYGLIGPKLGLYPGLNFEYRSDRRPKGTVSGYLSGLFAIDGTRIWNRLYWPWEFDIARGQIGTF